MVRESPDGRRTPLTIPNHDRIKGSTLRTICTRAAIAREDFLRAWKKAQTRCAPSAPALSARLPTRSTRSAGSTEGACDWGPTQRGAGDLRRPLLAVGDPHEEPHR